MIMDRDNLYEDEELLDNDDGLSDDNEELESKAINKLDTRRRIEDLLEARRRQSNGEYDVDAVDEDVYYDDLIRDFDDPLEMH